MEKITIDLSSVESRSDIHDILISAFELPEDYGRNLDALYDCLSTKYIGEVIKVETLGFETLPEKLENYGKLILSIFSRVSDEMARIPDNSVFDVHRIS